MRAGLIAGPVQMSAADDLLSQPYSAMDLAAFFAGLMALLFAALWRRDRERGMGWFAASMLLLALWMATNRWHLPIGLAVPHSYWNIVPTLTAGALTTKCGWHRSRPPFRTSR
jgi:hypothetical protein